MLGFGRLTLYADGKSARVLATQMPVSSTATEVACLECLPAGLPFYLHQPVTVITKDGEELTSNYILFALRKLQTWPESIVPLDQRDRWLASRDHDVYLLARRNGRPALAEVADSRGVALTELVPGWWGVLLPATGGT